MNDYRETQPMEEPLAQLERQLIDDYVRSAGEDPDALRARTDDIARLVLKNAAMFAGTRLAEIECRSHYVRNLHGHE